MAREIDRAELLGHLDAGDVTLLDAQGPGWLEMAASLLEGRGYTNVLRYTAGKADWISAGLPIETVEPAED